jgi:hypothetical protein
VLRLYGFHPSFPKLLYIECFHILLHFYISLVVVIKTILFRNRSAHCFYGILYVDKGTVSRGFSLQVFFMNQHFGRFRFFRKFAEIFPGQGEPRYQQQRWQIMGTISDYLHLKSVLKDKKINLYVKSTTQRCPNI